MSRVVIDASVVLRWAFEDEVDRQGAVRVAEALAAEVIDAAGPPNFLLEVASVVALGVRMGRIDEQTAMATLGALAAVDITELDPHGFALAAFRLALDTGLRVPDAAYVQVAATSNRTLITADRTQLQAAWARGVDAVDVAVAPQIEG